MARRGPPKRQRKSAPKRAAAKRPSKPATPKPTRKPPAKPAPKSVKRAVEPKSLAGRALAAAKSAPPRPKRKPAPSAKPARPARRTKPAQKPAAATGVALAGRVLAAQQAKGARTRATRAHRDLRERNKAAKAALRQAKREAKQAAAEADTERERKRAEAQAANLQAALVEIAAFEKTLASRTDASTPVGAAGEYSTFGGPKSETSHVDGRGFTAGQGNQFLGYLEGRAGIVSIVGFQKYGGGGARPAGTHAEVPPEIRERVASLELVHLADSPEEMAAMIERICDIWDDIEDDGGFVETEINYEEGTGS